MSTSRHTRFTIIAVAAVVLLFSLMLGGCKGKDGGGSGSAATYTAPKEVTDLVTQITGSATAEQVITATQKALTLGGTPIGDLDQVYSPATEPANIGFISPRAAFNMALEEHQRATSGRLTVTELGQMLKDFGWPFKAEPSPGEQMMLFFSIWVTEAQKDPTNVESFAPLFIAEMAKQQVPPIDLASGTGNPDHMRLTLLELELFSSALDRVSSVTPPPPAPAKAGRIYSAVSVTATDPCTQVKTSFGDWGKIGGVALEQGTGEAVGRALKATLGEGVASGINDALGALGTASRIWKLVQIYSDAQVSVTIAGGNQAHKSFDGARQLKTITATAGIPAADWQAYETNMIARGDGGKLEQVVKDCMQTFGFPTISDLGNMASSIDSWKVGWELRGTDSCGNSMLTSDYKNFPDCLAYFSQDVNPPSLWVNFNPPYKELTTKTGPASVEAVLKLDINEEYPADHENGSAKTGTVFVEAFALTQETPSLSTFINAAKGGLGLIDALVELGGGWLQTMFPPGTTIPLTVSYHVPSDDKTAPTVPKNLTATAASASRIDLLWSASTDSVGVAGYKIYRGGSYVKSVTGTSAPDIGLTALTPYCYQVTAIDKAKNESAKSAEACATTLDGTRPAVEATSPAAGETEAGISPTIMVTFSKPMDSTTITTSALTMNNGATVLFANYHTLTNTAEFTLSTILDRSTDYTATINTGVRDTLGNAPAGAYTWNFRTAATPPEITAFSFSNPAVTGIINESAKTITVTVPNGTSTSSLIASFTTTGIGVKVGSIFQTSGATPIDFYRPVVYTAVAANGTTASYTVTVTFPKAITAFSFPTNPVSTGIINESAKTISVTVPAGTNVASLIASFTITGTSVQVGGAVQTSGATANNFTSSVVYSVIAADGSSAAYTIKVFVTGAIFTDNGDGTITDNRTGLMWTQSLDHRVGGWQTSMDHCDTLDFAGHTDWRMPTLEEYQAVIQGSGTYPLDWLQPQGFIHSYSSPGTYWSSTTYAGDASYAWYIGMLFGSVAYNSKTGFGSSMFVWPVRTGP